jgi:uncharacterized membrane protein
MTDSTAPSPVFDPPPAYFAEALTDAESLLKYAAESGISIDDATRDSVLQARAASSSSWTEATAANLMTALTTLAALVKPVTAASLKTSQDRIPSTVLRYLITAFCMAILIAASSVASFLVSAISTSIRSDITTANALAVKLNTQTQPSMPTPASAETMTITPFAAAKKTARQTAAYQIQTESQPHAVFVPCYGSIASTASSPSPEGVTHLPPGVNRGEVIDELQQYATLIRSIDARARQLNGLNLFGREGDPCSSIRMHPAELHKVFELPAGIPDPIKAADDRTAVYQEVRYFAQSVLDNSSIYYGAMTSCILPALYALLGTLAYLLRSFEQQISTRTFIPSQANFARFFIAGIGGVVVGLFNNFFITQVASVSPLAIAFLVGYGVDVFFAFLEGLLQTFTRNSTATQSPPAKPSA